MANTTFGTLKTNFLRLAGNNYNSTDTTRLLIAGQCINNAISLIQTELKGHPLTLDIGNTVATVASQAYIALADTDILEVLQVSQRTSNTKLKQISYTDYLSYVPNPTLTTGVPELAFAVTTALNVSGQSIFTLWFVPTPSSAVTMYYDYEKNLRFTSDGTGADAEYSPFQSTYDQWIYDEAKPMFYEVIDPKNGDLINRAAAKALDSRLRFKTMILSMPNSYPQVQSVRERQPLIVNRVATTAAP